jgi:hypothetical protein
MDKGVKQKRLAKAWITALSITISFMVLNGCSQSGSGGGNGVYSGKALISSSEGGAITVNIADGTSVTLEVPEGALDTETEVTLSVTPQGQDAASLSKSSSSGVSGSLKISVKPEMDLQEAASLTIVFPENAGKIEQCLVKESSASRMIPVKQGMADNTLKGMVYSLGNMECSVKEIGDLVATAYQLMADTPEATWQSAYALFDALLYCSNRFGENGKLAESSECFAAVSGLCKTSAVGFLKNLGTSSLIKGDIRINALKKFKDLMILCENPDGIVAAYDSKLSGAGS